MWVIDRAESSSRCAHRRPTCRSRWLAILLRPLSWPLQTATGTPRFRGHIPFSTRPPAERRRRETPYNSSFTPDWTDSVLQLCTEAAWWSFVQRELSAIERSFVLPTDLPIPVFSAPAMQGAHARAGDPSQPRPTVVPLFSSAVAFDVDTVGSVANLRVTTSSLSGVGDTSVLAALERAQADGVLPPVPRAWAMYGPAHLHLLVSSVAPAGGGATRRVGVLAVPGAVPRPRRDPGFERWARADPADPVHRDRVALWQRVAVFGSVEGRHDRVCRRYGHVCGCLVNTQGHFVVPSVHLLRDSVPGISKRSAEMLPHFTFAPARIGSCAVNEVSRFTVHLPPDQR